MTNKALKIALAIILLAISLIAHKLLTSPTIILDNSTQSIITPYASKLIEETNKKHFKTSNKYTLYTANFEPESKIIKPNSKTKNILWLGSSNQLILDNIKHYDIILASHPYLVLFLKQQGINSFYFPTFGIEQQIHNTKNKHIALIDDNPIIEEILLEKNISYRKYKLSDVNKIKQNLPNFSSVIVNNTNFKEKTLDIHPIILEIALANIPIITEYQGYKDVKTIQLFNDFVSYYINKDDAIRLIEKVINPTHKNEITNNTKKAYEFIKENFSLNSSANNLKDIIENNKTTHPHPKPNSINIDIPTAIGHKGAGDYWLATDINSAFENLGYITSKTFFNSYIHNPTATNILVAGFIPTNNKVVKNYTNTNNIFYIAYPQFEQTENKELIEDKDTYITKLTQLTQTTNLNTIVLASKKLTEELKKHGINAYYIPQFTNTKRFYPDYDETLKSEVFFVGINTFYRKAAPTILEAGLPITIYGPGWNNAKADYLDNQILRKHYSSAKIVLNDTRDGMKKYGFISNRIFDATACETLVISDYMPEIEEIYGNTVPMYKTKEELVELVKYYLNDKHEKERKDKAKRAREITLKNFTSEKAAQSFHEIIQKYSQK